MYKREIDDRWSFRDASFKEYTHCYHMYPAMMIPQVARTLIREFRPQDGCNLLFDPFMGSGTSLVEAAIAGIDSIGTDLNPLARLIAKVKTTNYRADELRREFSRMREQLHAFSYDAVRNRDFNRITNYAYWYSESNLLKLSYLWQLIAEYSGNPEFFHVVLSEIVREASYTRNGEFKRFRMKEEKIKTFQPDIFRLFEEKVLRNLRGLQEFQTAKGDASARIYGFNSRAYVPREVVEDGSVDMVVTSPPYGDSRTTVAYGQFSRWANEWFSFENANNLDSLLLGGSREHSRRFATECIDNELRRIEETDPKRYWEVIAFLNDYWFSIRHVAKTVRNGGVVCYVVGNRTVKGVQIPLDYFTAETFERCGLHHVVTLVRGIPNKRMPSMTSPTNVSGAKVDTMSNEYIVILRK